MCEEVFAIYCDPETRRSKERVLRRCSLCGAALRRGDACWQMNGLLVCGGCFPVFARRVLAPYYFICGEGEDSL